MSNPTLSDLLDMEDEEVFELIDEEYGLLEKQGVLYELIDEMSEQIVKLRHQQEEMAAELTRLKKENARLHDVIKKESQ